MCMENTTSQLVLYKDTTGAIKIDVRFEGETVWLTQKLMAELFDVNVRTISEHITNIYRAQELGEDATLRNFRIVQKEGKRAVEREIEHYHLDMILAVGYRVNSPQGTAFRQWATERLSEYVIKGFTMDDERLKGVGGGTYWKELLERIRDIRSSEKVLYRQVLDLYATSIDYDAHAQTSIQFFKTVQNKLHCATNEQTAAETIHERADAGKDFMGLTTFAGAHPRLSEVSIAKNYLTADELFRLNRLVSAFFDLAEIKALDHVQMRMADWATKLDTFAAQYGKGVLHDAGHISHERAIKKAEAEYKKYQAKTLSPVEETYIETLKGIQKKVAGKVKKVPKSK
jgi:hypothetical protein